MRYSGKFGFAEPTETAPGVMEDVITERDYIGDVAQRTETLTVADSVLPQYRTSTSVSVFSDGVLAERYNDLRYISYMGNLWSVTSVVLQAPRMVVYFGDLYTGPVPEVGISGNVAEPITD